MGHKRKRDEAGDPTIKKENDVKTVTQAVAKVTLAATDQHERSQHNNNTTSTNNDGDQKHAHGSTIFVSNLSYATTSEALKDVFSDLYPVRSAFVVFSKAPSSDGAGESAAQPQTQGASKGVGYVSFAIREDAEACMRTYGSGADGGSKALAIEGRNVRVQWPHKQSNLVPDEEGVVSSTSKPKRPKKKPTQPDDNDSLPSSPVRASPSKPKSLIVRQPADPNAIRTIRLSNLPPELTHGVLWKKVRKQDGAVSVEFAPDSNDREAYALFDNAAKAQAAIHRLHAHVFKGSVLSAVLKKRVDGLVKSTIPSTSTPGTTQTDATDSKKVIVKPSAGGRLIVRNLPWDITEEDLHALFTPYGPLYSVHLPKPTTKTALAPNPTTTDEILSPSASPPNLSSPSKTLAKGFAFIWFLSKKDAEHAMDRVNGTKVIAGLAKMKKQGGKRKKEMKEWKKKIESEGRVVAVDWALSKQKWMEVLKEKDEESGDESEDLEAENEDESGSESEGNEGDSENEALGVHEGTDSEATDGTSDEDEEDAMSVDESRRPPQPEEGSTLFLRNVPFEAGDDDLKELFRSFGPIRYARVTMDREVGRSRGTGFVSFWKVEDADKVIEEAERIRETMGGTPNASSRLNPFSMLTPDPSSSLASRLVLLGRTIDVTRAVSRDQANKLRDAGERKRERTDTRNLYLMKEGVILPSSPAASLLPPAELERRTQSYNARRALLRSNPSLYVSRTRLSVRHLPTFATERVLKRLALYAARAFEDEAKQRKREGLTEDEIDEQDPRNNIESGSGEKEKKPARGKGKNRLDVKQAKIVRQADRVEPLLGKGRSKGYGFVEMGTHADALRVLRWANNNPDATNLMWGWWKEELEDWLKRNGKVESGDQETKSRIARVRAKVKEMQERVKENDGRDDGEKGEKAGRTLLMEFSIENVSVVQRRKGKENQASTTESPKKHGKRPLPKDEDEEKASGASKAKKQKLSPKKTDLPKTVKEGGKEVVSIEKKPGQNIGSLIGRKRKERKQKKRS